MVHDSEWWTTIADYKMLSREMLRKEILLSFDKCVLCVIDLCLGRYKDAS